VEEIIHHGMMIMGKRVATIHGWDHRLTMEERQVRMTQSAIHEGQHRIASCTRRNTKKGCLAVTIFVVLDTTGTKAHGDSRFPVDPMLLKELSKGGVMTPYPTYVVRAIHQSVRIGYINAKAPSLIQKLIEPKPSRMAIREGIN
jgi:hypothetical protein